MTAALTAGRTLGVTILISLALAAGATARAGADVPVPVISSPAPAAWIGSATPAFGGTTSDITDPLTLRIYSGTNVVGEPVETLQTLLPPLAGVWALTPPTPLASGTYTAIAEQAPAEEEAGVSAPVTFTIDTTAPAPTIATPAYGAVVGQAKPLFTGEGGEAPGDESTVRLEVYADGPGRSETLVETLAPLTLHAGEWTTGTLGAALPDGLYTAYARQSDQAGNIGTSEPLTFTVETRPPATNQKSEVPAAQVTAPPPAGSTPAAVPSSAPQWLSPFPVVRIAGYETVRGARISLLTVQAPVGASVTVACSGHGCPLRSEGVLAGTGRHPSTAGTQLIAFRRFEIGLKAGVTLEIRVSRAGEIGKYVRFTIRRGKLPLRQDRCLDAVSGQPIGCPSS